VTESLTADDASPDTPEQRQHEAPDAALVADAREDQRAFDALYERYARRVYRYARARIDSDAAAEDIVSDTMLAALEGIERFDPAQGTFAGWLFTIASRRITDRRRRRGRFLRLLPRAWEPEGAEDDALTTVIRDADAASLRQRIASLPERDRELVLLRYNAALTSAEIGQVLGMSSSAVRVRLMRILQRLSSEMEPDR
jgi:RNA polymerase sigma-70 factor, ECF subfamily